MYIASMRWSECGGGLHTRYIEGRKQWNGREDENSVVMVSYARYIIRVPAGSMARLLQQQQQ